MKDQIRHYDEYYLKFKGGEQTRFVRLVKEKCFGSWNQLADFLGVNRSMVFFTYQKSLNCLSSVLRR